MRKLLPVLLVLLVWYNDVFSITNLNVTRPFIPPQKTVLDSLIRVWDSTKTIIKLPYSPIVKPLKVPLKKVDKSLYATKMRSVEFENKVIEQLLIAHRDSLLPIISNPKKYRLQIIYTQINRDKNNVPTLKKYRYFVDEKKYFYPASMVKLPVCALALQKINETNISGFTKKTPMITDAAANTCQTVVLHDSSSVNYYPSIEHYIKKMLLVSDNVAYSRCYEYLGREYISNRMCKIGMPKVRIIHRFDTRCKELDNACSNPILFLKSTDTILQQEAYCSKIKFVNPIGKVLIGKAYMTNEGAKIMQPKNFTAMNYFRLDDIDAVLKRLIFPSTFNEIERFMLTDSDYQFLRKYMSMVPRESDYPMYPDSNYEDSYKKYLLYGTVHGNMDNDSVRIFNIVGQSYGFLGDCAYIVDFKNGIEFFLSAVIYVNEDGIINDGKYEYKQIGFPFLTKLGRVFYDFERSRKKENSPKLDEFKFKY